MTPLLRLGRTLFGLGWMGLGFTHFVFRDFTTGRAPAWPDGLPGGSAWAWVTGAVFMLAGAAILSGRRARVAALLTGGLVFFWALLRHLPVLWASPLLAPEWTQAGKAFVFVAGALAVSTTFRHHGPDDGLRRPRLAPLEAWFLRAALVCAAAFLIVTGIQHFIYGEFVASLIPPWFPGDAGWWTALAGVALVAGGVGLLPPPTRRWAAGLSGAMILSWFFIVHVTQELRGLGDGIAVFEALVVSGVLFLLAAVEASRPPALSGKDHPGRRREAPPASAPGPAPVPPSGT